MLRGGHRGSGLADAKPHAVRACTGAQRCRPRHQVGSATGAFTRAAASVTAVGPTAAAAALAFLLAVFISLPRRVEREASAGPEVLCTKGRTSAVGNRRSGLTGVYCYTMLIRAKPCWFMHA